MVKGRVLGLCATIGVAIMSMSPMFSARRAPRADDPPLPRVVQTAAAVATSIPTLQSPLEQYRALLTQAEERLRQVTGYTATFVQQVRKGDRLLDAEEIRIKVRHEPFSVYMDFGQKGLQVLYVDGANDGRLLARRTRGLLQRTLRLEPTSRMAMMTSRQPVTELGLLGLVLQAERTMDACPPSADITCEIAPAEVAGNPVRQYTVTFGSPAVQETYSKCLVCFRTGEPLPVCITCYGWTADGAPGELIEHYHYRDVQLDAELGDPDFDPDNAAYAFRD
jgi:hypothetical protein